MHTQRSNLHHAATVSETVEGWSPGCWASAWRSECRAKAVAGCTVLQSPPAGTWYAVLMSEPLVSVAAGPAPRKMVTPVQTDNTVQHIRHSTYYRMATPLNRQYYTTHHSTHQRMATPVQTDNTVQHIKHSTHWRMTTPVRTDNTVQHIKHSTHQRTATSVQTDNTVQYITLHIKG